MMGLAILMGVVSIVAQLYAAMRLETTELFFVVLVVAAVGRFTGVPPGVLFGGGVLAFVLRYCRYAGTNK